MEITKFIIPQQQPPASKKTLRDANKKMNHLLRCPPHYSWDAQKICVCGSGFRQWPIIRRPAWLFKVDDHPVFPKQTANGQLEKPLATTTVEFDIGDHTLAEHILVRKKLTPLIKGLQFMRQNSVVLDTTQSLIHFPTWQCMPKALQLI